MAQRKYTREQLQEAMDAYHKVGTKVGAAKLLGLPAATYDHRYNAAERMGYRPTVKSAVKDTDDTLSKLAEAKDRIRQLESSIAAQAKEDLSAEYIKKTIIKLNESKVKVPSWTIKKPKKHTSAGIPTLFASDWHWGEIVDPNQINGVNEYNIAIAQDRAKAMVEKAVDLLKNHVAHSNYPGIVFVLGGDMVSGDIHEELMATNEMEIMPTVIDLFGVLTWCITTLADEFGQVFVPCVSGNHGRNTHKMRAKGRNFTSFDWLPYQFLWA
jgi:hypothetical protein